MEYKCRKCELSKSSNYVPGIGKISNGLFIVGSCPIIGQSERLLDLMLNKAGIIRESIYITNVLKCLIPLNQVPKPEEILNCTSSYLEKEIAEGNPKVIIALGMISIEYFTGISNVSKAMEQRYIRLAERKFLVVPAFPPSFILRQGKDINLVKGTIEIFKRAKKILEIMERRSK